MWSLYLLEDVLDRVSAVVAQQIRLLPREFSVGRPVILARQTAAREEVLGRQHLLPLIPGVGVVKVAVVVVHLLVGVDRPGGHHHALTPIVGPRGVGGAAVVGQADAWVHRAPELDVLTVDEAVALPEKLVDLIGIAGAGLDVLGHDGGHLDDLLAHQVGL